MGFFEPSPPPFDLEEWRAKPHLSRLKPLVQDWGVNGFGSPTFVSAGGSFPADPPPACTPDAASRKIPVATTPAYRRTSTAVRLVPLVNGTTSGQGGSRTVPGRSQ
jgi:hypothetical protein